MPADALLAADDRQATNERLKEDELVYKSQLAEVFNQHREQVDALNLELTAHEEDLQQGYARH